MGTLQETQHPENNEGLIRQFQGHYDLYRAHMMVFEQSPPIQQIVREFAEASKLQEALTVRIVERKAYLLSQSELDRVLKSEEKPKKGLMRTIFSALRHRQKITQLPVQDGEFDDDELEQLREEIDDPDWYIWKTPGTIRQIFQQFVLDHKKDVPYGTVFFAMTYSEDEPEERKKFFEEASATGYSNKEKQLQRLQDRYAKLETVAPHLIQHSGEELLEMLPGVFSKRTTGQVVGKDSVGEGEIMFLQEPKPDNPRIPTTFYTTDIASFENERFDLDDLDIETQLQRDYDVSDAEARKIREILTVVAHTDESYFEEQHEQIGSGRFTGWYRILVDDILEIVSSFGEKDEARQREFIFTLRKKKI